MLWIVEADFFFVKKLIFVKTSPLLVSTTV